MFCGVHYIRLTPSFLFIIIIIIIIIIVIIVIIVIIIIIIIIIIITSVGRLGAFRWENDREIFGCEQGTSCL